MCSEKGIGLISQIGMHLRKTSVGAGTLIENSRLYQNFSQRVTYVIMNELLVCNT